MAGKSTYSEIRSQKNNFMIKETARCLASQSKFYSAASILVDFEDKSDILVRFLMVECYVRLGRERKADKAMKEVWKFFLQTPETSIELLKLLADSYGNEDSCVREIFARKLLSEMYIVTNLLTVKEKFDGAHKCLHDIQSVSVRMYTSSQAEKKSKSSMRSLIRKLKNDSDDGDSDSEKTSATGETRLQVISLDYGMEYMKTIMKNLESMPHPDEPKKARDLAKCTNAIGYLYGVIRDQKRSMAMRLKGIDIMDREFGKHALDYNLYGDLHHNVGVSLFNMERFKEAQIHYEAAIDAYHRAVDYPSEAMRTKDLKQSQSDLRQTRSRV